MSVMAETPPRPRECLSDAEMNIDAMGGAMESGAKGPAMNSRQSESNSGVKRKASALPSPPLPEVVEQTMAQEEKKRNESTSEVTGNGVPSTPAAKKPKTTSTSTSEAASTPLVQLKNGKLVMKQKQIEWSRSISAMQATIAFNQWLEEDEGEGQPAAFPEAHLGLIAILSQESDKSLNDLAKYIKNVIVPAADLDGTEDDDDEPKVDRLPLGVVTEAIERVAERVNYGIDTMPSSSTNEVAIPAALQLWRWEVRSIDRLAAESREKIVARREDRQRARQECAELLAALPQEERAAILSKGRKIKPTLVKASEPVAAAPSESPAVPTRGDVIDVEDDMFKTPPRPKMQSMSSLGKAISLADGTRSPAKSTTSRDSPRPSSATVSPEQEMRTLEKEEKRKEREAKRAEKVRKEAEKEAKKVKAEQAKKRAASFMSSFVKRPRSSSPTKADSGSGQSDFDRAFPPCNYKDMAPVNRFRRHLTGDVAQKGEGITRPAETLLAEVQRRRPRTKASKKGIHPRLSVRDCMRQISAAGVMGDGDESRRVLLQLADRDRIPVKLLHFHTDRRPAWLGTWTRSTNFVSGRRPLGQDPVALDYNYDSDAEWEEVDPFDGDDVQDNDKDEEDNDSRSGSDSELDDWLVDDLEVEEEDEQDHPALKDPNVVGFAPPLTGSPNVNRLETKKKTKKYKPIGRRFETKLVKFETGPHWEAELGVATYAAFQDYQMEMLNDAYVGIDPFTFTTDAPAPEEGSSAEAANDSTSSLIADASTSNTSLSAKEGSTAQSTLVDRAQAFPEASLGDLLQVVEGSTSIRSVLLEELKQRFGALGKAASKANMDACLHKYAEPKSKKAGSKWQIKPEYRGLAGLNDADIKLESA